MLQTNPHVVMPDQIAPSRWRVAPRLVAAVMFQQAVGERVCAAPGPGQDMVERGVVGVASPDLGGAREVLAATGADRTLRPAQLTPLVGVTPPFPISRAGHDPGPLG